MFPFAFWGKGWRSESNSYYSFIAYNKKIALPPISNIAPQQKIVIMMQRPTCTPSGNVTG